MVGIPPALPPLLHLPPAFWSSQSLRGLCRSPSFPGQEGPLIIPRRKRADATPGLLHGTLRTQPCRRSSGLRSSQSPHLPHPLSLGAVCPRVLWFIPLFPGQSSAQGWQGEQKQPVHRDKGRSLPTGWSWGTAGVSAVLKERTGICLPEHHLGTSTVLSMSTSITLLRPHSISVSPFSR